MKWQYKMLKYEPGGWAGGKVDTDKLAERFNELGGDGWEMVSSFPTQNAEGLTREIICIFKQPVIEID